MLKLCIIQSYGDVMPPDRNNVGSFPHMFNEKSRGIRVFNERYDGRSSLREDRDTYRSAFWYDRDWIVQLKEVC